MARLASPPGAAAAVVESGRELLNQAVQWNRRFGAKRPAGRHLLGREQVEQDADVRAKLARVGPEVPRGPHGDSELRKDATSGRNGERLARRRTAAREQRVDGLSDTRSVGIGHEQPNVVSQILEPLLSLQRRQCIREHARATGVERVDGQRPNIRMLHQVALDSGCQHITGDCRPADGRLRHAESCAYVAKQPARVLFPRRCVERPEWMDIVDRGEHATVAHRQHRRKVDRREPVQQSFAHRPDVLLACPFVSRTQAAPSSDHARCQSARSGCVGATSAASRICPR